MIKQKIKKKKVQEKISTMRGPNEMNKNIYILKK